MFVPWSDPEFEAFLSNPQLMLVVFVLPHLVRIRCSRHILYAAGATGVPAHTQTAIHSVFQSPVEIQQDGQHGLIDVAVADALIEQVAGIPNHRLQRVLSHDVVELICVEVLKVKLVPELSEVVNRCWTAQTCVARSAWFRLAPIGQI